MVKVSNFHYLQQFAHWADWMIQSVSFMLRTKHIPYHSAVLPCAILNRTRRFYSIDKFLSIPFTSVFKEFWHALCISMVFRYIIPFLYFKFKYIYLTLFFIGMPNLKVDLKRRKKKKKSKKQLLKKNKKTTNQPKMTKKRKNLRLKLELKRNKLKWLLHKEKLKWKFRRRIKRSKRRKKPHRMLLKPWITTEKLELI